MSQMSQFVSGCRGVVITGQRDPVTTKRETMALCAINYGSFQLKVPQTLIAGTSFSDSGNVILWERERQTLVASTAFSVF